LELDEASGEPIAVSDDEKAFRLVAVLTKSLAS
jgi:hypothetical protein